MFLEGGGREGGEVPLDPPNHFSQDGCSVVLSLRYWWDLGRRISHVVRQPWFHSGWHLLVVGLVRVSAC